MARRRVLFVDWHSINGSATGKRKLSLQENEKGNFTCPVKLCLHSDFGSRRGLRKHIDTKHPWYYYFDVQPEIKREEVELNQPNLPRKASTNSKPYYSMEDGIGNLFLKWLTTTTGGGKNAREAKQIAKRALKFLMHSSGENEFQTTLSFELVDCCLGSTSIVLNFLKVLEEDWKMSSSGSLNYVKAMADLMDFRKSMGVNDTKLRCFTITDVYLRRARENLRKKKRLDGTRNFDLETLIGRDSWASLAEMEQVIPYHISTFREVVEKCKSQSPLPNKNELAFCTRFITTFLFLRVKCSRPMTFQFLTLPMIAKAKANDGFIDQREFKTASTYLFDTLILTDDVLSILDVYIDFVRPLASPTCEYLLVSTAGNQYQSLTSAMTLLVHQAIGKYIHPTRYRQIVETASADKLTVEEQQVISEDQKHSSGVAKTYYKLKQSRRVAIEGKQCMEKLIGSARKKQQETVSDVFRDLAANPKRSLFASPDIPNIQSACSSSQGSSPFCSLIPDDEAQCSQVEEILHKVQRICSPTVNLPENLDTSADFEMEITNSIAGSTPLGTKQLTSNAKGLISQNVVLKKERVEKEVNRKALKNVKFTSCEDVNLLKGINKYGPKNWAAILKDQAFNFHQSRTRDSLRVRADSVAFKKRLKNDN